MEIVTIPLGEIIVGERQRQATAAKVADLAASIEQVGLLQPIGVIPGNRGYPVHPGMRAYRLVFGLHRMQAMQLLEREEIDAYVLPPDLHDEEYMLIELQENSARHDLTGAQRKGYAGEIGRLKYELSKKYESTTRTDQWFSEFVQSSNTPRQTCYDWWHAFCQETGFSRTPKQAMDIDKQQFFTWLEEHKRQANAERQRKAEAAERAERDTSLRELHEEVEEAILLYGWDVVYSAVLSPVLEAHDGDQRDA